MGSLDKNATSMIPDEDKMKAAKAALNNDRRDIADLWNDALDSYKGIARRDLRRKYKDVDSMFEASVAEQDKFLKWRHDGGKIQKLRTLFKNNMSIIEKGTQKLLTAAEPAFPPAAAIGTALTFMLAACKSVSADYDVITVFFEDMLGFMSRVKILERRLPDLSTYHNCLMDVFTSLLKMCAFATVSMETGRFKKWVVSLFAGEDPDLAGARKQLDGSLEALKDASQFAILGNTEELKSMQHDLQKSLEEEKAISARNTYVLAMVHAEQAEILDGVQQLLAFMHEEKTKGQTAINDASLPSSSINRLRSILSEIPENALQMQMIREAHVKGTCTWLWDEPAWKSWIKPDGTDSNPWLLLVGPPGIGKSHLAVSAFDRLREIASQDPNNHTCTAYAFCRDSVDTMQSVDSIIVSAILQIADQNITLREQLNLALTKDGGHFPDFGWDTIFKRLIMPLFVKTSRFRLNLIIDAVNELTPADRVYLGTLMDTIQKQELRIRALVTNRPASETVITTVEKEQIVFDEVLVTKTKILPDLKNIIQLRLQSGDSAYQGLQHLSKSFKGNISETIEKISDTILYAEHILRHLSTIGRPGAIDKELRSLPADMNALFMKLMEFSQRRTPADLRYSVKILLAWLTFSFDPLTLDDANFILQSTSAGSNLLMEQDVQEFISKFIRFGAALREDEDLGAAPSNVNDISDQSGSGSAFDDGQLEVVFRERSMREFFRKANINEDSLRTYESAAHKEIFLSCCQILAKNREPFSGGKLLQYALKHCLRHWMCIGGTDQADLNNLLDTEKIAVCSAFKTVLSDRNSLASALENAGDGLDLEKLFTFHKSINVERFYGIFVKNWNAWSENIQSSSYRSGLDAETLEFWSKDHDHTLIPLARAHIDNWLAATDPASVRAAYNHARKTLKRTSMRHLLYAEFPVVSPLDAGFDAHVERLTGEKCIVEILGLRHAFRSELDSNAHYATAVLLNAFDATTPAMAEINNALEICKDDQEKARVFVYLGRIGLRMLEDAINDSSRGYDKEIASDTLNMINEALKLRSSMLPSLNARALHIKAEVESLSGQGDAALNTCRDVRAVNGISFIPTEVMSREFKIYLARNDHQGIMNLVTNWKPLERLTWIVDQTDFSKRTLHQHLLLAAVKTERVTDLIEIYNEIITKLDVAGCGAIWREYLASTLWRVMGDSTGAEDVLDKVLDSSCNSQEYVIGNTDAGVVATRAVNLMCDILYQRFRQSDNVELKLELLEKVRLLPQKRLVQSVQIGATNTVPHLLVLARMTQKVERPDKVEKVMRQAFDICWGNLHDNLIWNDPANARYLARILMMLAEQSQEPLWKGVDIMIGSQLYFLDKRDGDGSNKRGPPKTTTIDNTTPESIEGAEPSKSTEDPSTTEPTDSLDLIIPTEGPAIDDELLEGVVQRRAYAAEVGIKSVKTAPRPDQTEYSYYHWTSESENWKPALQDKIFLRCTAFGCDKQWRLWYDEKGKEESMNICRGCADSILCQDCYNRRSDWNDTERPAGMVDYCCDGTSWLSGPSSEWIGIKNGDVHMLAYSDDDKAVAGFDEYLTEIKDMWERAWSEFWKG